MSRRALGGWMLVVLGVALLWAGFSWWRSWSAPLVPVVFRPSFSVEGIASGTPVRVQGVVVGQVSSIGLEPDDQGRLRPDRKSTRLNSSHLGISYAVLCLKNKTA